jgi:hypothetical protein
MHEQTRGLVDNDQAVVLIEDGQGGGAHAAAPVGDPR